MEVGRGQTSANFSDSSNLIKKCLSFKLKVIKGLSSVNVPLQMKFRESVGGLTSDTFPVISDNLTLKTRKNLSKQFRNVLPPAI